MADASTADGRSPRRRLVRLGPDDAPAVAGLEARCFTLPWNESQFRAAFAQSAFAAYGLQRDGALVGYVSVYHTGDELEILNIAVAPERRRQGHARRLLGLVLRGAVKMGIVRSVLEVRPGNAPALALYRSHGYRAVGRRPGYYPDTGEDALILAVEFAENPET